VTAAKRVLKDRRCKRCVHARLHAPTRKPTHPKKKKRFNFDSLANSDLMDDSAVAAPAAAAASSSSSPPSQQPDSPLAPNSHELSDDDSHMDESPPVAASSAASASASASAAAAAPAWQLRKPLPLVQGSAPLEDFIDDFLSCFILYGYCLIRANQPRADIATRLGALRATFTAAQSTPINGGVDMFNLPSPNLKKPAPDRDALMLAWVAAIEALIAELPQPQGSRRVSTKKLLSADPRRGRQVLHFDALSGPDVAHDVLSLITCCSAQTSSTFLPRFPLAAFKPSLNDRPSMQKFAYLLAPE